MVPDAVAGIGIGRVRAVLHVRDGMGSQIRLRLRARRVQHRAQELAALRRDAGQAVKPGPPGKVEQQLRAILPPEESNDFCHRLVLHGRAVCRARKPDCPNCVLRPWCDHFQNTQEG